jgi:alkylated DNA repair dioxygenase AlkB
MRAPVSYQASFLAPPVADRIFTGLFGTCGDWSGIPWERRSTAPRYEYWCNDFRRPYTYGRGAGMRTYEAFGMPDEVEYVRRHLDLAGTYFEGCFLNGYNDSRDALGWHSDDDPGIDHSRPIAIVTLGQPRMIEFKEIGAPNGSKEGIMLEHGSLCFMHAGMQQTHVHQIPKASFDAKPRISLTYRALLKD